MSNKTHTIKQLLPAEPGWRALFPGDNDGEFYYHDVLFWALTNWQPEGEDPYQNIAGVIMIESTYFDVIDEDNPDFLGYASPEDTDETIDENLGDFLKDWFNKQSAVAQ